MSRIYRHGRPTIGVLAGWQFYWTATPLSYLNPIFRGITLAAHDLGCNLLLSCGMGTSATPTDPLRPAWPELSSDSDFVPIGPWNTDGLIAVNPLHSTARSTYLRDLIASDSPVVFIGAGEHGPTLVADNRAGLIEAMRHLVDHGHQRIAFIAGSADDLDGDSGDRLRAYQTAVQTYHLADQPELIAYGRHVIDGGYAAMQQILKSGVPFTAVMASNDESAFGALRALREAGWRIPHDVAVIGFDDRSECAVQSPPLSSVRVPLFRLGYQAVELMVQRLEGRSIPDRVEVPTRLIVRESCGCGYGSATYRADNQLAARLHPMDLAARQRPVVQAMADALLIETQHLNTADVQAACQRLVRAFAADTDFKAALGDALKRYAAVGEDVHLWQHAISILSDAAPELLPDWDQFTVRQKARERLDQARFTISAEMRRQHQQHVADQQWQIDRIGLLTAHLLTALDEAQVYDVLAQHLPEMGIAQANLALFEAEGNDPVAWSNLRTIQASASSPLRFHSREFPPADLFATDQPFSQALLPLIGQRGQTGYVAFDTSQMDLYGAIVQQLAAALNTAQLYREATEGRRLAEEANRLKSRFLSTVSHELRTPLNLVVGLSEMLLNESDAPLPAAQHKDIERIHLSAQHLGYLIGDVLDLASSEAGQLRLTNELIDLSETLRLVTETGYQLAHDKGLAWRVDLPESGPWVWGDRTRLRQVALNLISNAVKFTATGEVRLTLEATEDTVTIAVSDTGLGIAPDEQAFIFDEFRQSQRSTARGYSGLGLGLAICKRLIELHSGSIGVRSTGEEGAGSTFYFTLPIVPAPATEARRSTAPLFTDNRVVVLTSRSDGTDQLRAHLQQRGLEVRVIGFDDEADWQASLTVPPPGLIVLDMSSVPRQGWDVLKVLKRNPATQAVPVLFYSLAPDTGSVLELDYLTKPIGLADLTTALDRQWLQGDDSTTKTVLIVDDDPNTVEMHARLVASHATTSRVLKAHTGREALALLEHDHADLILLDLMMPELDGFGVLAALREREATRDIPVIVVTGQALTESDMARLNRGVATVLSKGLFSVEETLAHIEAALERKRKLSLEAQRLVRQAMAYMHEHYAEPVARDDVARHVGLSDDYLTACFRKELGMTPVAYLTRYRINQAKQRLTDTNYPITEIALAVGFSDSGYFSRVFRREVGVSPEAYRRGS